MPGCIIEYLSGHLYVDILKKEVVPRRHAYSSFFFFEKMSHLYSWFYIFENRNTFSMVPSKLCQEMTFFSG